jgi:hypothetical protein
MLVQQNHAAGGADGSFMVVMFVSCVFQVFRKQKAFWAEVFVPAGTDLAIKPPAKYSDI